jgi:class 3 adenylate cyclase
VQPETRYARVDGDRVAYQIVGEGVDLVLNTGSFSHVDIAWEEPGMALFLRRLASFSRLIRFDRRGTGASDPPPGGRSDPAESYAQELLAVIDAAGTAKPALMGLAPEAGLMALLFAAAHPDHIGALIVVNATAKYTAAPDYPIGLPAAGTAEMVARVEELWGTGEGLAAGVPSRANDERFRRWAGRVQRSIASPRVVQEHLRALLELDARPALHEIQAPTLVLHRREFAFCPIEHGRYLADHIADARFVELPGADGPIFWETPDLALRHVEEFLTGVSSRPEARRVLATVLFTDIVGSTERAAALGDRRWREVLDVHDELIRRNVERWEGRVVKLTGDGALAIFDVPRNAIACAADLDAELGDVGLEIRSGVHTGEVELRDGDVGGIGVHTAARIMALAEPGEILVSRTVRDLVAGSGVGLRDRGTHRLRGLEGEWDVFAVV